MPESIRSICSVWNVGSIEEAAKMGFIGMPGDPAKPMQLWRDNAATYSGGNWWDAPTASSDTKTYKIVARSAIGNVLGTPFESREFYATYTSLDVVGTYREFSFLFGPGRQFQIPYLVDVSVPKSEAAEPNFKGTLPARDYPVALGAHQMLTFDGVNLLVWDVMEFRAKHKPPAGMTPAQRVTVLAGIINGTDDPVSKLQKVGLALQGWTAQTNIIT